jgi:hypothetical protein
MDTKPKRINKTFSLSPVTIEKLSGISSQTQIPMGRLVDRAVANLEIGMLINPAPKRSKAARP